MATFRENLVARRDAIGVELAALNAAAIGGKPNVKNQDGGTVLDHTGYKKSLYDELAEINRQLMDIAATEAAAAGTDGPFEVSSENDVGYYGW